MSEQTIIYAKTICVNCRWHNGASRTATWYDHRCRCPAMERQPEQDPVTGEIGFPSTNDLGGTHIGNEKHPFCRDYNHGNCEHFERRTIMEIFKRTKK